MHFLKDINSNILKLKKLLQSTIYHGTFEPQLRLACLTVQQWQHEKKNPVFNIKSQLDFPN